MTDTIIGAIIGLVGAIIAAMLPLAYQRFKDRISKGYIRDIRGRWVCREKRGNDTREHIIEIRKQHGREIEGYRILKGGNLPTRKYLLKGFFTGDLLSASIMHEDEKESRILCLLLRIHTSEVMKGKYLLWRDNDHVQASQEHEFIRDET